MVIVDKIPISLHFFKNADNSHLLSNVTYPKIEPSKAKHEPLLMRCELSNLLKEVNTLEFLSGSAFIWLVFHAH